MRACVPWRANSPPVISAGSAGPCVWQKGQRRRLVEKAKEVGVEASAECGGRGGEGEGGESARGSGVCVCVARGGALTFARGRAYVCMYVPRGAQPASQAAEPWSAAPCHAMARALPGLESGRLKKWERTKGGAGGRAAKGTRKSAVEGREKRLPTGKQNGEVGFCVVMMRACVVCSVV